ncbi:MAG: pyridoxine 5'-phosphate synthase [Nitratiruptor sp.]|nr:pyridoxine 5'-phosphate synthase [Nitratiruptor sp.]NPA83231.1 pyridoxine 5'-phosphate synthase [Campylobacterota bacterium]
MRLGVNIDHIAVLREARKINDPDPLDALGIVGRAGADQITIHLREDRRHINDYDAQRIIQNAPLPVNMECSLDPGIIEIVCRLQPHRATLVPERREEVTTEGGLDVVGQLDRISQVVQELRQAQIDVSLFVDPNLDAIGASAEVGADMVELHTGEYANIYAMLYTNLPHTPHAIQSLQLPRPQLKARLMEALEALEHSAIQAGKLGLIVAAGHGLNYQNVEGILRIPNIEELNIGQSIIARSVWVGLEQAVREMVALLHG